jgi:hypothetical protein
MGYNKWPDGRSTNLVQPAGARHGLRGKGAGITISLRHELSPVSTRWHNVARFGSTAVVPCSRFPPPIPTCRGKRPRAVRRRKSQIGIEFSKRVAAVPRCQIGPQRRSSAVCNRSRCATLRWLGRDRVARQEARERIRLHALATESEAQVRTIGVAGSRAEAQARSLYLYRKTWPQCTFARIGTTDLLAGQRVLRGAPV